MLALQLRMINYVTNTLENIKAKVDDALVEYDGWFPVLLAVLLSLAFLMYAAMTIWCVVYKGKRFTGNWKWDLFGTSTFVECV